MWGKNNALIERLRIENDDFLTWEKEHQRLERKIRNLNKKHVLTPEEDVLRKTLQKEKLHAKDRMVEILTMAEKREKVKKGRKP